MISIEILIFRKISRIFGKYTRKSMIELIINMVYLQNMHDFLSSLSPRTLQILWHDFMLYIFYAVC